MHHHAVAPAPPSQLSNKTTSLQCARIRWCCCRRRTARRPPPRPFPPAVLRLSRGGASFLGGYGDRSGWCARLDAYRPVRLLLSSSSSQRVLAAAAASGWSRNSKHPPFCPPALGIAGAAAAGGGGRTPLRALAAPSSLWTVVQAVGAQWDWAVLRASFTSSLNLLSLCSFVVWLQTSGQLPSETPTVLSQVAFRVLIPCFLMSKVCTTLVSQPSSSLLALPAMAILQVLCGAILGNVAFKIAYRPPALNKTVKARAPEPAPAPAPAPPVAATVGAAGKGEALLTAAPPAPPATAAAAQVYLATEKSNARKKEALITACCAFNNSLTLPLVFLSGVLSAENASQAAGYIALYMVAWSPCLWTVGYRIIAGDEGQQTVDAADTATLWTTFLKLYHQIMNPPLYGVFVGILLGTTPLSHFILPLKQVASSAATGALPALRSATAGILRPVFDAATLLGSAAVPVQTMVLASSIAASVKASGNKAFKVTLGQEAQELEPRSPEPLLDKKAFWIIAVVRLLLLPAAGLASVHFLVQAKIIPPDPILMMAILVEAAMPTAQNLVLLAQLRPATRPLAGMLADLMLRQYALSILPITLWMAVFLTYVPTT